MALTGFGKVFFDDVRIEPLVAGGTVPPTAVPQPSSAAPNPQAN
jgi:hypothetical protein